MCPGHLVKKWQREVTETIPDAQARIIRSLEDVLSLDGDAKPQAPEYIIVSKDRAKLGYVWRPAVLSKRDGYYCPDCNGLIVDKDGIPVSYAYFKRNKRFCPECKGALWQADNTRIRRYPLSEYIKDHLKGYFDFYIADEVHELKGGSTARSNSFGALANTSKKTIALTGTLFGGYADDIFYVLYRLSPGTIKDEDIRYNEVLKWMGKYGVLERVTKSYPQENILPPPIPEEAIRVQMDQELEEAYQEVKDKLFLAAKSALAIEGKKPKTDIHKNVSFSQFQTQKSLSLLL
jgi:hypothetical protein